MAEAIRTTVAIAGATLAQSLLEPSARAAAIAQLWHLPWGHPHALELRRKFRLLEKGQR
jgi:hypothetical protein